MKKITKEELNTRICSEKIENIDPSIYSLYHSLITLYFINGIDLKNIDNIFSQSNLNFPKVNEKDMDIYQYLSSDYLNYFYIRNNLYLENLNKDELNFLINKKDEILDIETINFLNNTILKVIYDKNHKENYYANVPNKDYLLQNNKVIIGFRYDEFKDVSLSDDEWDELNKKQNIFIDNVLSKFQEEINIKKYPIIIMKYSEFLINKMR